MVKIISFEGGIGSGKTSLTNYFSHELKIKKILENYDLNPFLKRFYNGDLSVNFETEICFLLLHYSQIRDALKNCRDHFIITDFSIEKDLIFAKLNLEDEELKIFKIIYHYIIKKVGFPYLVIFLDLSPDVIRQRIAKRGHDYEINANPNYFKEYNKRITNFFEKESHSKSYILNVDQLQFENDNEILKTIRQIILDEIK